MLKKWLLTIFSVLVLAYGVRAEEPPKLPNELEAFLHIQGVKLPKAAKVKAAYIGMGAEEIDATLRAQLKLPAGVGMVVNFVGKDGPADAAGVRVHDILYKLDDQIIINTPQLVTLVRMHKPGDSVELTVIREAQQTKLTVKLVEGEVPPLEAFSSRSMELGVGGVSISTLLPKGFGGQVLRIESDNPASGQESIFVSGSVTMADDDSRIEVTSSNGKSRLVVKDKAGKVLYDGLADPNAKEIPESLREKIRMIPALIIEDDELIKQENKSDGKRAQPPKTDGF